MSGDHDPQKLKFSLWFVKIDAEGERAIQAVNIPLLILVGAISLSLLVLVATQDFSNSFGWIMNFVRAAKSNW